MEQKTERPRGIDPATLVADSFRHQAMLLAGLIHRERLPDHLAWELVNILEAARKRLERQVGSSCGQRSSGNGLTRAHPAIAEFLHRVDQTADVSRGRPVCAR